MDESAKDLIDKLLRVDPNERIGCGPAGSDNDIKAIKTHPFFKSIDFKNLHNMTPPIPMH